MPSIALTAGAIDAIRATDRFKKETFFCENVTGFVYEARPGGKGTYALRYKDKYGKQCQFKIAAVGDITFADAKRRAIQIKARVAVGESPQKERKVTRQIPTFEELSVRYLEFVKANKKSHDIDERWLRLQIVPKFGNLRIDQLRQDDIVEWLAAQVKGGYSQATVNRFQVIISYMMRLAKQWKVPGAEVNPLEGVRLKEVQNAIERFLNPAETKRLKEAVEASPNPMLKHIVALLLLTGCRKRELLDARWDEVSIERKVWRIPTSKTGKPRHVPLSDDAIAVLEAIPRFKGCSYIVPNPTTLLPFKSIYNSWHSARVEAKLPDVRIHDLRHSCASNLVNAGQSLYVVAKVLGHAQTRTTERYAHLDAGVLLNAVNAAAKVTGTNWSADQT